MICICCLPVTTWYKCKFDGANLKRLEFKRHGPCIQGREPLHTKRKKKDKGRKEGRKV